MVSSEGSRYSSVTSRSLSFMRSGNFCTSVSNEKKPAGCGERFSGPRESVQPPDPHQGQACTVTPEQELFSASPHTETLASLWSPVSRTESLVGCGFHRAHLPPLRTYVIDGAVVAPQEQEGTSCIIAVDGGHVLSLWVQGERQRTITEGMGRATLQRSRGQPNHQESLSKITKTLRLNRTTSPEDSTRLSRHGQYKRLPGIPRGIGFTSVRTAPHAVLPTPTCQCLVTAFQTPILPVWLVAMSWLPTKNRPSTGTPKWNTPAREREREPPERPTSLVAQQRPPGEPRAQSPEHPLATFTTPPLRHPHDTPGTTACPMCTEHTCSASMLRLPQAFPVPGAICHC